MVKKLILSILFLTLSVCSIRAEVDDSENYVSRDHSLARPYSNIGKLWDFLGHTMITNNYVRLTPDLQSKSGAIWNTSPVMNKNWEVHVSFKVHGKGTELFGDGFALWYAQERMIEGPVFGSKDYFSGLAIILDTYSNHNGPHNHQHPFLSAMVNNGTLSYDHDRDGTHTQLAGCEVRFRNVNFDTHISIRYENEILSVSTDMENRNEWKNCFVVQNVELPTGYYFGASATTGDLSDTHDILAIKFYDLDKNVPADEIKRRTSIVPNAKTFEPPREHVEDPKPSMSNLKIFFILLVGSLASIAAAIFGYSWYKERNARKRFY